MPKSPADPFGEDWLREQNEPVEQPIAVLSEFPCDERPYPTFREYFPGADSAAPVPTWDLELERLLNSALMPALAADWEWDRVAGEAGSLPQYKNENRTVAGGAVGRLLSCAHALDEAVHRIHPRLGLLAAEVFWGSEPVFRFLEEAANRLVRVGSISRSERGDALAVIDAEISNYRERLQSLGVGRAEASQPSPDGDPAQDQPGSFARSETVKSTNRRALVDEYITEVLQKTGKRINRTGVWKKAGYSTRTEFERWQRQDHRATKTADENFTRILREKPHLKCLK